MHRTTGLFTTFLALTCAAGCSPDSDKRHADRVQAGSTSAGATTSSSAPTPAPATPASGGTTSGGSSTPAPAGGSTAPTPPPPPPPGAVGSRYWYENDAFGNPYEVHNATEAAFALEVFRMVNQERAAAGLPALIYDGEAELAAKVHVEDMEGRAYFSHVSPEGWTPYDRLIMTGASGFSLNAENIAIGQQDPPSVMRAWMTSAGHRANILHADYTHIGVGVAEGRPLWAQVFLRRP